MNRSSRYFTVRGPFYSFMVHKRAVIVTLLLLAATIGLMIFSSGVGSVFISPAEVVRSVFGYGADSSETIVRSLRLPRIVVAVLIGAALSVSGAILQGVVRNSLASPDTLGMTWGGILGAVTFFFFYSATLGIAWLPIFAVVSAFAATLIIYALAWKNGVSPLRLVLVGIGFTAAMNSLSYMMMISGPVVLASQSLTFMTGSIYGVSWDNDVLPLLPWVAILLPLAFIYARHVNIQELGEDVARSVGSTVQRQRFVLILISVALAGAGIAFGGAINFIGLMGPHIARKLVGPSFGALLPVSALVGALLLLVADMIGRSLFGTLDIPAGVFTASVGAPFFIYLLYRSRNR